MQVRSMHCAGRYYKKKGAVQRVLNKFVGEIRLLDSGDVIRVDQVGHLVCNPPQHMP